MAQIMSLNLAQLMSLNLAQLMTFKDPKLGPDDNFTAYIYIYIERERERGCRVNLLAKFCPFFMLSAGQGRVKILAKVISS